MLLRVIMISVIAPATLISFGLITNWRSIQSSAANQSAWVLGTRHSTPDLRGSKIGQTCLRNLDIRISDSFFYIDGVLPVSPNPNGPNQNIEWVKGKRTDFFSTSWPENIFSYANDVNRLDSNVVSNTGTVFCLSFDDEKKLQSLSVSWLYTGDRTRSTRNGFQKLIAYELHLESFEEIFKTRCNLSKHKIEHDGFQESMMWDPQREGGYEFRYEMMLRVCPEIN